MECHVPSPPACTPLLPPVLHPMLACPTSLPQVELLTEVTSVAKRLAADEFGLAAMVACNVHEVLTQLLQSTGGAAP